MIIGLSISEVEELSKNAPSGYYDHIMRGGTIQGGKLLIEDSTYRELWKKYRIGAEPPALVNGRPPINQPIRPIDRKDWPIWAKALAQFAKPQDKGVGDVVARIIGDENSLKFKAWHQATFGKPCNCNARQARWNAIYPL